MCYQFIYYPSPNFFIKHLVIDKNHIVRYIGAVAAGVVGPPGGGGGEGSSNRPKARGAHWHKHFSEFHYFVGSFIGSNI